MVARTVGIRNMGIGGSLRQLARFLDDCEQTAAVSGVGIGGCADGGGAVTAEVELSVPTCCAEGGGVRLRGTDVNPDGTLGLELETTDAVVPSCQDVTVEQREATVDGDGTVRVTLSASVDVDRQAESGETGGTTEVVDGLAESNVRSRGSTDRDVPPFKDPDLLTEVYDSCETFAEMADRLDMDVTAETVRRYMIDYGIHEPNTYDTGSEGGSGGDPAADDSVTGGDEEQVVLSDGIGLPEGVTVETLVETVEQSNTIYEVKRDVGVGREDALDMLRELGLLDLVVGRLATEAERDITRADVVERLRDASATQ